MIFLILIRAAFYLLLSIVASVIFCFFLFKSKDYLRRWSTADADVKIIGITSIIVVVILLIIYDLSDSQGGYLPLISMMLRVIGISLAIVAAIIAFRNYRRKSGDKLSYVSGGNKREISVLLLRNEKDKTTSIFAIDVVLVTGERIRLVDFLSPIINPLNLSAFQTEKIELEKVHLYGCHSPKSFNFQKVLKVICITSSGEYEARTFTIDSLREDFLKKNKILLANRIRNIAVGYEDRDIDPKAEYWLYLKKYCMGYNGIMEEQGEYILTGFLDDQHFFLTDDSLSYINDPKRRTLKKYCENLIHTKKVDGQYSSAQKAYADRDGYEYLINGFFWEDNMYSKTQNSNDFPSLLLDRVEKIVINNAYD